MGGGRRGRAGESGSVWGVPRARGRGRQPFIDETVVEPEGQQSGGHRVVQGGAAARRWKACLIALTPRSGKYDWDGLVQAHPRHGTAVVHPSVYGAQCGFPTPHGSLFASNSPITRPFPFLPVRRHDGQPGVFHDAQERGRQLPRPLRPRHRQAECGIFNGGRQGEEPAEQAGRGRWKGFGRPPLCKGRRDVQAPTQHAYWAQRERVPGGALSQLVPCLLPPAPTALPPTGPAALPLLCRWSWWSTSPLNEA